MHIGDTKALYRSTARQVDTRPDGCRANAVARRWHGGEGLPGIRVWIVGLDLGKNALRMGRVSLPAKDIETAIDHRAGNATTGGWQCRFGGPGVGARIKCLDSVAGI